LIYRRRRLSISRSGFVFATLKDSSWFFSFCLSLQFHPQLETSMCHQLEEQVGSFVLP
jgi:hypothetical protein